MNHSPWHDLPAPTKSTHAEPVFRRAAGDMVEFRYHLIHGRRPGKTLLVTGCVHGDEFEGPASIWKLIDAIDPEQLAGTLVAIPVVNIPAYEAGLRVNPDDRQDLARVFPGDPTGTATEQIAAALTQRFIRFADFYIDLHSAGSLYKMPPLVGYTLREEPLLTPQREAAKAMGFPLIWGTRAYPGRSLSAAGDNGVPSLYVETTGQGRCLASDVDLYQTGLLRLMHHLGMIESAPPAAPAKWLIEDDSPQAGFLQVQNRTPVGGFFEAFVDVGQEVEKGQLVGDIRDVLGHVQHEVHSPHTGLVIFVRTFSRVLAGDPVCTVLNLG